MHFGLDKLLFMRSVVREFENKTLSSSEKSIERGASLREARIRKGLTQVEVAERAGIHRNTIRNLENGVTGEVRVEHATALGRILGATPAELGLRVKRPVPPLSVRIRRLTPDQRELVSELLSLPPEDFEEIRDAVAALRKLQERKTRTRKR